ncbi:MAG TPA: hypothetical protein VL137_06000, partial [Polyangiaceae bacterium]|nr:hypothetical protein [Polyangiaceae bacterium]
LFSKLARFEAVEQLLAQNLERAQASGSNEELLNSFLALGSLYQNDLKQIPAAIDAFEAAHTLEPNSDVCIRALTELYATSSELYSERGIALHLSRVHHDPFQAEPYKQLRRLYTEQRRADAAWCLCQVLNALGLSSPDEDQFYERLKSEGPAALQEPLSNDDWQALIHPDTDQLITAIFSALEGIVIAGRAQSLEALGFAPETAVDTSDSEGSVAHVVVYTAQALGFGVPYVFDGPHLTEAVVPLPADVPAVALGLPLLDASASAQASVFVAARALCLLQPGFRLRHLLTSGTVLKAWLLAAVKFNSPAFPVPAELVGPVSDALAAIQQQLPPTAKDDLTRLVAKLIQGASELNLKKWIAAIDFTIDRVGFLLSNDLKVATESIAQANAAEMAPSQDARLRELIFFAVSETYFDLRKRLQLGIDG